MCVFFVSAIAIIIQLSAYEKTIQVFSVRFSDWPKIISMLKIDQINKFKNTSTTVFHFEIYFSILFYFIFFIYYTKIGLTLDI